MYNAPISLTQRCQHTEVKFGTNGVRAPIDALTPEICQAFTKAFLATLCPNVHRLAIGIDLRPSSPDIAQSIIQAAQSLDIEVIHCGALPTPNTRLLRSTTANSSHYGNGQPHSI